jgi:hypothetical protein
MADWKFLRSGSRHFPTFPTRHQRRGQCQLARHRPNSVYTFEGRDWFVAHAYDAADRGWSKLKVLELTWNADGKPTLAPLPTLSSGDRQR